VLWEVRKRRRRPLNDVKHEGKGEEGGRERALLYELVMCCSSVVRTYQLYECCVMDITRKGGARTCCTRKEERGEAGGTLYLYISQYI
jgi:hypothetical protein